MDNIATALLESIHFADLAVFSENPLPVTIVPKEMGHDPRDNPSQFAFCRYTSGQANRDDFYVIFEKGLREYFEVMRNNIAYAISLDARFGVRARLAPNDFGLVEFEPYNEARAILGAAVHEVRHRVQFHLGVALFNKSHTDQVNRCRLWGQVQAKHYGNGPHAAREFDAKLFECYVSYELIRGRLQFTLDYFRDLLLMTPERFLEIEK